MNRENGHIRYVPHHNIDLFRWDDCIDHAENGLIYGKSHYLSHMTAGQWDALVTDDYSAVMPLPWKRKWGIKYLYQPAFTQQLGVFSLMPPNAGLIENFLAHLTRHFRFAEIFLNYDNNQPALKECPNFILPLNHSYEELSAHYKKDLLKNLKLTTRFSFQYVKNLDQGIALSIYQRQYRHRTPHIKEEGYRRFGELCLFLQRRDQVVVRAVTGGTGEPLATALLFVEKQRMYLVQSTVSPGGRQTEANHFLLDQLIREFAATRLTLDFEGSAIPGIAHFYRNFGSRNQPYYFYRHSQLPWPLRLFKAGSINLKNIS
jgi:Acetyltransferase (GNAT) domain